MKVDIETPTAASSSLQRARGSFPSQLHITTCLRSRSHFASALARDLALDIIICRRSVHVVWGEDRFVARGNLPPNTVIIQESSVALVRKIPVPFR